MQFVYSLSAGTGSIFSSVGILRWEPVVGGTGRFVRSDAFADEGVSFQTSTSYIGAPHAISASFDREFTVVRGRDFDVSGFLQVRALNGLSDFGSTAAIDQIIVPDGMEVTAASGQLRLAGDHYIYAPVPEPGTVLMTGAGLSMLLLMRRRARGSVRVSTTRRSGVTAG